MKPRRQDRTADTVQLVDHHPADQAPLDVGHKLLEAGAVRVLTGKSLVLVVLEIPSPQLVLAELDLPFNADTVLAVHRLSRVDSVDAIFHCRLLSVSEWSCQPLQAYYTKDSPKSQGCHPVSAAPPGAYLRNTV